jgi:hypothetical protein
VPGFRIPCMRKILTATMMLALAAAAFPPIATAQTNSAIDQYTEGAPGAGGSNQSGGGSAGGGGQALPQSSADALDAQGSSGQAAANLAQSTAPPGSGEATTDRGGDHGGGDDEGSGTDSRERGDSKGNTTSESGDSGGFGVGLPILLFAALVAAVAFTIVRRRRGPDQPSQAST